MAYPKSTAEIQILREGGHKLARALETVLRQVTPGVSTGELDRVAEAEIRAAGGIPVFKGYRAGDVPAFPATICASINEEVVHGIPQPERRLQEGDLLKIDIGMRYRGMVTDMARTVAVGKVSPEAERLMSVTRESLKEGIKELVPGSSLNNYGRRVEECVRRAGFSVVRDLVGHGVGHELHEPPHVPNYASRDNQTTVVPGMVLALEPMVNAGTYQVALAEDEWTVVTADGALSAHFEDTVVITEQGPEVVTRV